MKLKKLPCALACVLSFAFSLPAHAADKACLLEGTMVINGKSTPMKDCLENAGVPDEQFKSTCDSIAKMGESLAKSLGGAAPKTTYLAACPAGATNTCTGFFGQPMTSYYYKRDAAELIKTKESCLAQGGKWK